MQSILDTALRNAADEALARADIIAALPATRQAVAAKDRERLLAEYAEMFAVQKERRGITQAQFHRAAGAVAAAAAHAAACSATTSRASGRWWRRSNREQAARKGLAIARGGPAIFGVAPVKDAQGEHVGSFEFGLEFGPLLDGLKAAYGLDFALFVEEKPLREYAQRHRPGGAGGSESGRPVHAHSHHQRRRDEGPRRRRGYLDLERADPLHARRARASLRRAAGAAARRRRRLARRGRGGARLQRLARGRRPLADLADLPWPSSPSCCCREW